MNNLEIDLTKNLERSSKFISKENINIENKFIQNYSSEKYNLYLNMIEKYFQEMKSKRYNSKFRYYINDDKNYIKEAIERKT